MYMITIVQTQAYRITGDRKYIDRAAREMVMYLDELQCPNGLSIMHRMFLSIGAEVMAGWLPVWQSC